MEEDGTSLNKTFREYNLVFKCGNAWSDEIAKLLHAISFTLW